MLKDEETHLFDLKNKYKRSIIINIGGRYEKVSQ